MTQKIALVDDDQNIVLSVKLALESEGFDVVTFHDGEEGYKGILAEKPDLAILDIKMPRMDGVELLTKLRETSHVPVIFLTSKSDEVDEVIGLRLGADDYVAKPFSQRLLIERIRSVLRRYQVVTAPQPAAETHIIVRGMLELDDERHLCRWNGKHISFTVTEYLLLKALAISPGFVKSRDQLMTAAYGDSVNVDDRTIDTHIKRIRSKIKAVDRQFDEIETLYGVGYRYKDSR